MSIRMDGYQGLDELADRGRELANDFTPTRGEFYIRLAILAVASLALTALMMA